jgi:hypothetical protein
MSVEAECDLPSDGPATVGGFRLPPGRRLAAEAGRSPVLWATGEMEDAAEAWLALLDRLAGKRLVPVLLSGPLFLSGPQDQAGGLLGTGEPGQPGGPGAVAALGAAVLREGTRLPLPGGAGVVGGLNAAALLGRGWDRSLPGPDAGGPWFDEDEAAVTDLLAPYSGDFPGLSAPSGSQISAVERADAVASLTGQLRLGLVAASRPADVPAVIGWEGAESDGFSPAALSCVLRSWEDRFGARLVRLGSGTIELLVERPVYSREAALAVAAEHFAFCSENFYGGGDSIASYADDLPGAAIWSFWWD